MVAETGSAAPNVWPFESHAWVDDDLVAVSSSALQLVRPDAAPLLCFPVGDLRCDPSAHRELQLTAAPAGYVAWNPDDARVRISFVDGAVGEAERDRTVKRFPAWGTTRDLIGLLDVRPEGDRSFVSTPFDSPVNRHRGVVEGSQLLAQAIVAATRVTRGRRVVSASMLFMRAANPREPLQLQLDELSGGRTFSAFAPQVRQAGKLCASGIMLLDAMAPDVMRHADPAPATAGPYASEPLDMSVIGRDVRFVDGAYTGDTSAPVGPPLLDAWLRYRDVPEDPALHLGLLAHFSGHASIATAMRPHAGIGLAQAHRTLSTAVNAIHISFHAHVRADRWMLYRHHSTFAGDGMTHSECKVYDLDGGLLASFSVEAMVRPQSNQRPSHERTSL